MTYASEWLDFPWGCSRNGLSVCVYAHTENCGRMREWCCIVACWLHSNQANMTGFGQHRQLRTFWGYFTVERTLPRYLSCRQGCLKYFIEHFYVPSPLFPHLNANTIQIAHPFPARVCAMRQNQLSMFALAVAPHPLYTVTARALSH